MRACLNRVTLLSFLLGVLGCVGADFPALKIPEGVGVNIHFTRGHEQDLDLIAAAGIKFVRMDFVWASIEREQGVYQWADYEELVANLEKRGLRAIFILDYSNALYEQEVVSRNPVTGREQRDVASPRQVASIVAFARWAGAAAGHFAGKRIVWEIWNEPNISFWKPKPDVNQYIKLALATANAVRDGDSETTLIAPATSEVPVAFLEAYFLAGALEQLNGVSIHPYRNYSRGPETAAEDFARVRELIVKYAPPGDKRRMPIISGEWGYPSHTKGVSLETQAAFAVRQQLSNLLHGVPISIWYDWKDDGTDPAEREHNFGLVNHERKPKPAYLALKTMIQELRGRRVVRRLDTGNPKDYAVLFANEGNEQRLAVWTTGEPHSVSLELGRLSEAAITAVDGLGAVIQPRREGPRLGLDLSALPAYVNLGTQTVP